MGTKMTLYITPLVDHLKKRKNNLELAIEQAKKIHRPYREREYLRGALDEVNNLLHLLSQDI